VNSVGLGGSWLHRLYVERQVLESELDTLFDDAPWPVGIKVVLYNEVDAGLGDVAFMTKLIHLLAREPGGPTLVLVTTGLEKQAKFVLPEGVLVIPATEAKGHEALRGCDLVISAPGIFDHCRDGDAVREALGLAAGTPFIYLAEYGSIRQLRVDAFRGLAGSIDDARDSYLDAVAQDAKVDADHVGFREQSGEIVIVEDAGPRVIGRLDGLFLNPEDPRNPLRDLMGSPILTARSCGLERGELGVHIDESLWRRAEEIRAEPRQRLHVAAELEHSFVRELVSGCLAAQGQLYQGYAHSGHAVFHDIITVVAQKDRGDVLVVSPDRRDAATVFATDFSSALRERMAARGFGGVAVTGGAPKEGTDIARFEDRWGDGPTYEVVTIFPLVHEDMKRLMLISEAPTMVSGDQSFSDAISALKSVAVIEPVYCQTWHLDAVCVLAATIDEGVEAVLRAGLHYEWSPTHLDAVMGALESRATWDAFERLTRLISSDGNANRGIIQVVKRAIWTLSPNLRSKTQPWLDSRVAAGLHRLRGAEDAQAAPDNDDLNLPPWHPARFSKASVPAG